MSSTSALALGDGSASAQEVESVIRECEALKGALARGRSFRFLLLLATLALLAGLLLGLWRLGRRFQQPEYLQQIMALSQEQLNTHSTAYMREVETLFSKSSPVLSQAFYNQAKKDLPLYLKGVESEREKLTSEMTVLLDEKLSEHFQNMSAQYSAILREQFPEVEDPEAHQRLTTNLGIVLEKMAKKYYVDELKAQFLSLYDSWDQFPMAEKPATGTDTLEDQFTGNLLELLKVKLTEADSLKQSADR